MARIDSPAGFFGSRTDDSGEERKDRVLMQENFCIYCGAVEVNHVCLKTCKPPKVL